MEGFLCVGFALLIAALADRSGTRFDYASKPESTISNFTRTVLGDLNSAVDIVYFAAEDGRHRVTKLLHQFSSASPRISTKVYDLNANPGAARYYGVTKDNSAIVEVAGVRRLLGGPGEDQLLQAIIALTAIRKPKVYFLLGHGERDPVDTSAPTGMAFFHQRLLVEGYKTEPLDLQRTEQVPVDADIILIGGPRWDLAEGEVEGLEAYVMAGGRLLALVDHGDLPRLSALLERLGLQLSGQIVVDQVSRLQRVDLTAPLIPNFDPMVFGEHQGIVIMPVAQALAAVDGSRTAWTRVLATSAATSWITSPVAALDPALQPPADAKRGPFPLAAAAGLAQGSHEAAVVAVGDSDFVTNAYFLRLGNEDFALNIMNWLAGRRDWIGKARSRPEDTSAFSLSQTETRRILWFSVVGVPSLFLVGAAGALIRRRRLRG